MADRSDLEALFLAHLPLIERILAAAGRRQGLRDDHLADYCSWARLRLVADDYAVLRRFRGESTLATYLTVVLTMAAREYRVAHWGRWRPSAAARAQGPLAVRLETLVHRDGFRLDEAAQLLHTSGESALSDRELAELLARLPVRAGRWRGSAASAERDGSRQTPDAVPSNARTDDKILLEEADEDRSRICRSLSAAIEQLPADDRLLLRLRYWHGLSVADSARALGILQKPLYRRMEKAIGRLRDHLTRDGIAAADVRTLCDGSLPPTQTARDESRARPSMTDSGNEELSL